MTLLLGLPAVGWSSVGAAFTGKTNSTASFIAAASFSPYKDAVLADSPTVYYRLDDGAGTTTAVDTSPNNIAGTYTYTTSSTPGYLQAGLSGALGVQSRTNAALSMSGSNGVQLYVPAAFNNPTTFTEEVWIKTTTTLGGLIMGFSNVTTGIATYYDRHVYMLNDGRLTFGIAGGSVVTITSTAAYNDGTWHLIDATVGAAGTGLYVDGTLVVGTATNSVGNYTGYLHLGGGNLNGWPSRPGSDWFAGTLDEYAIYPTQLTQTRIQNHYNNR